MAYLDRVHERIVTVNEELYAELLQEQTDTQRWLPLQLLSGDSLAIFSSLCASLIGVKCHALSTVDGVMVDDLTLTDRLHVGDGKCATKTGMPAMWVM